MPTNHVTAEVAVVTDETFEREVLDCDKPVLVDFWAPRCPPCRMIAPVLDEIARERVDSLVVRKLNTEENPYTARDYQIMAVPTLIVFRAGERVRTVVGARSKARLLAELADVPGE